MKRFSYPFDTVLSGTVQSLEHDGANFWALEEKKDGEGETIGRTLKRWRVHNYVCKLQQTLHFDDSEQHIYDVDTFSIEHYHTVLTTTASGGSTTIYIDDYSDSPGAVVGSTIHIGPNEDGDFEDTVVSGTVFGGITLEDQLVNSYVAGDAISFHKYIWMFNNNNGTDETTGALYKFDSSTGDYVTRYPGGQYKDITACTFYTVPSFVEYGPVDTLAYIKGTNTLFVDVSENASVITDAEDANDDFTDTNGSPPNTTFWDIKEGSPTIQNNKLHTSTALGEESLTSAYYLRGNFEVSVMGTLSTYPTTYSGAESFEHLLGLMFTNEADRYCYIARANNDELATQSGINNFHILSYKTSQEIEFSEEATYSGGGLVDSYEFRMSRAGDNVSFYYKKGAEPLEFLGTVQMFDSPCKLMLGLKNTINSSVIANFDDLVYDSGELIYYETATELPFYGSMVMENISADKSTVISVYDLVMAGENVYRLQNQEDGGGSMSGYNYQLSPLASFVTSISLAASPAILAANGISTSDIVSYVKDQFLQPIAGRRVTFSVDAGDLIGGTQINTDSDGMAQTEYKSGTTAQEVIVTAVVEQTN